MPIEVAPQPAPILAQICLCEQRSYGGTAYPTITRIYVDGDGNEVRRESDPPQAQINLAEWPDLAQAHQTYVDLLERAAAHQLGYIVDPQQAYTPEQPTPIENTPLD